MLVKDGTSDKYTDLVACAAIWKEFHHRPTFRPFQEVRVITLIHLHNDIVWHNNKL